MATRTRYVAIFLTALVGILHLYYAFHAGGLWRDEAQAVAMASMPSISEIWVHLEHESFPMLWLLIVRAYESIGADEDLFFRLLGCLVGLSLVAALWINARQLNFHCPLVSLALLGFSPTVILWGDSMRAYGFGTVLILLTFAMVWKVVTSPSPKNVSLAAFLAICSVQALYHNAVLLLSIGMAGTVVASYNRHWFRAAIVIGIGIVAAVSLIPYLDTVQGRKEWSIIFTTAQFDLPWYWTKISGALSSAGPGMQWVWVVLLILAMLVAVFSLIQIWDSQEKQHQDLALFCLTTLVISIPGYFLFLKILGYPTQPWYYLALMAIVALAVDGVLSIVDDRRPVVQGRWWIALGVALWSLAPIWNAVQTRQTNIDLIAAKLQQSAVPGDMILMAHWYYGVSFDRYYTGSVPWMTLPPIRDHRIHRYDLLKAQMATTDPIQPVLDALTNTLKSGKRVYVVGSLVAPTEGTLPPLLKPAPFDTYGWNEEAYSTSWRLQAGHFLQTHALRAEFYALPESYRINPYENVGLKVVQGWQD